jgi:hypothetical protein
MARPMISEQRNFVEMSYDRNKNEYKHVMLIQLEFSRKFPQQVHSQDVGQSSCGYILRQPIYIYTYMYPYTDKCTVKAYLMEDSKDLKNKSCKIKVHRIFSNRTMLAVLQPHQVLMCSQIEADQWWNFG